MVTFGHSNAKGDLKTSKSPVPLLRGGSPQGWAYGSGYFLWIIGNMENVCTFVPSLIKVCYNLLQIRHHPNDVFSFFMNHTTEGRTLNLPKSFSQVANNLINDKENELCGDSGYYQDGLPDTYQGKSIHTYPPR